MFEISKFLHHHLHLITVPEVAFETHAAYSGVESQLSMNLVFLRFLLIPNFPVKQKRKTNK